MHFCITKNPVNLYHYQKCPIAYCKLGVHLSKKHKHRSVFFLFFCCLLSTPVESYFKIANTIFNS